jgi:hypothetical protein
MLAQQGMFANQGIHVFFQLQKPRFRRIFGRGRLVVKQALRHDGLLDECVATLSASVRNAA